MIPDRSNFYFRLNFYYIISTALHIVYIRAGHTVVAADSATLSERPTLHIGESWLV